MMTPQVHKLPVLLRQHCSQVVTPQQRRVTGRFINCMHSGQVTFDREIEAILQDI